MGIQDGGVLGGSQILPSCNSIPMNEAGRLSLSPQSEGDPYRWQGVKTARSGWDRRGESR